MKTKIRLTESELTELIKKVVKENESQKNKKQINEMEHFFNPEALSTGKAIATIIGTVIGLLGISGYDYLLDLAKGLKKKGKHDKAEQIISYVEKHGPGKGETKESWMEEGEETEEGYSDSMMESRVRIGNRKFPRRK